jgi:prepilin-type N-terminal cleavage/methylation domain-containing protein
MKPRKGFTLIEMMVVIAIVVILGTIAAYGITRALGRAHITATRTTMESLKSMLSEYDVRTHFGANVGTYYWGNSAGLLNNAAGNFNFWLAPSGPLSSPPTAVADGAYADPGNLASSSDAVRNTAVALYLLQGVPSNRVAFDRLPSNVKITWKMPLVTPVIPAALTRENVAADGQLVLDAWNNPIIFVPASGLRLGEPWNVTTEYNEGDYVVHNGNSYRCLDRVTGSVPPNPLHWQPANAVVSPTNRPFFVSAGPDGDFSRANDNLYSFEQ